MKWLKFIIWFAQIVICRIYINKKGVERMTEIVKKRIWNEKEWSKQLDEINAKIHLKQKEITSKVNILSMDCKRKCEDRETELKDCIRKVKKIIDFETQEHRARLRANKSELSSLNQELKRVFEPYKKSRNTFHYSKEVIELKEQTKKLYEQSLQLSNEWSENHAKEI
jgi:hypothetical protein